MAKLTPMMAQYKKIKEQHQDCVLMFRLGDFYEMFFEDAERASKILQITLTSRNKGGAAKAPMCGVPFHAVDQYIYKLTQAGEKVALCDQVTEPDGKGIVEREVVRIITPGTTFNENVIEGKSNNFVSAIVEMKDCFGLAYSDITTGEFKVTELKTLDAVRGELLRIRPSECVGGEELIEKFRGEELKDICFFPYSYLGNSEVELLEKFEVASLSVFGLENRNAAVFAGGFLMSYLKETQKSDMGNIRKIDYYDLSGTMPLDEVVLNNLELFYTMRDKSLEGSLIWALDNTVSSLGGRLLRRWLLNPLLDIDRIRDRHKKVDIIKNDSAFLREVRDVIGEIYDIERLISKLSLGSGNARDLVALGHSLKKSPLLAELIRKFAFGSLVEKLVDFSGLTELIDRAICDEPMTSIRDGGMIREGFNSELDELRSISKSGKEYLKSLQERESKRLGVSSLKVKFNKVFGYYIEISKSNLDSVPDDYIRKQTLVNAERFITPELKEYEEKVLSAEDKIKELEYELFYEVRMAAVKEIKRIQEAAGAVAELDVYSTFAFNAEKYDYVRPEMNEECRLDVKGGRHAVVEILNGRNEFVPNDCSMDSGSFFHLITGPNMGGKSTYLRQVALIVLMAQIGCFIPATTAVLPVFDRIFTRVGASDNLVKGESTFMVEMQETSFILNNATENSLVILDEVGRGTSTYDGVSIAWALTEYLHDEIKAKTLFATHYHELIELCEKLAGAENFSVAVRENEKEGVVFLYRVVEGGVDKSYGIEVAKLAGLPAIVVSRARGVLKELEQKHISKGRVSPNQTDMFEGREIGGLNKGQKEVLEGLKNVDIEKMTPLQALEKLDEMKKKSE